MAEYAKIYKKMWNNSKFRNLTEDAKFLWVYILSCPHSSLSGIFVITQLYIQSDLGWLAKRLDKAFAILLAKDFIGYDYDNAVILIPAWFEHNNFTSNNQLKKANAELSELPQTYLLQELKAIVDGLPDDIPFAKGLAIPLAKGLGKGNSGTGTGTGTGTGEETELNTLSGKPDRVREIKLILDDLNEKSNKHFEYCVSNIEIIKARLNEDRKPEDFFYINTVKCQEWNNTDQAKYIRPETLYCKKHFESYLNQKPPDNRFSEVTKHNIEVAKAWLSEKNKVKENQNE